MTAASLRRVGIGGRGTYPMVTAVVSGDSEATIGTKITAAGVGGSIYFGPGTYTIVGTLSPLDNQRWWGPGVLKADAASVSDLIHVNGKTGVKIDLTLDGGMSSVLAGNPGAGLVNRANLVNIDSGSTFTLVRGRLQNNAGDAVRIYDSSWNTVEADIYNCYYGVVVTSGGSAGDPGGGSHYNHVTDCKIEVIGKNAVYFTGHNDSTALPNALNFNRVTNVTISQFGDTGIEIGQGSHNCTVSGVTIDGGDVTARLNGWGFNGILVRDGTGHSISGFTIRNIGSYTNGNGAYITLGNGIYLWPQFTGVISEISIGPGEIENCSRGVFVQGNNTTFDASTATITGGAGTVTFTDAVTNGTTTVTSATANFISSDAGKTVTGTNIPASTTIASVTNATTIVLSQAATGSSSGGTLGIFGRQIYAGVTITGVVVGSTQLGMLDGSWATFQTTLESHGFYIQSATGVMLSNCIAKNCQNDGFRLGDTAQGSSFATDVLLESCMAFDNGQQNVGGQNYYGFNLFGTGNQARIKLNNCQAFDSRVSGAKTQTGGYNWNGNGSGGMTSSAAMVACTANGNKTLAFNNCGNANIRFGTIASVSANYSVATTDTVVVFTGSTASQTITLPSITTSGLGREIRVINNSSVTVTIAKSGGGTLAGPTSLAAGAEHIYVSDGGSNWY